MLRPITILTLATSLLAAGCGSDTSDSSNSNRRANPGSPDATVRTVQIDEISGDIEAGKVLLVDVRTRDEWDQGRAARAMHVPLDEVEGRIEEIRDEADERPVAFICRTGNRSAQAASTAAAAGLPEVINIDGGMEAWVEAGLELDPPDGAIA